MSLGPIHDIVVDESGILEEILEEPLDPNIIWLLFELERLYVIEILLKLDLKIINEVQGRPSHRFFTEIEAFFYFIVKSKT